MGFLDTVIKDSGNEFASKVSDGVAAGDTSSFVDTGSYIFNAVVSGSLFGGIPSNKVTALADKQVRDMTKSQLIKGAFRILTLKLGQAQIPMIVTNHTYDVIGSYVPMKEMGGGAGLKYAASTIVFLTKSKEKEGTDLVGNIIKCEAKKSRLSKEGSKVATRLYFDERGLDKYYGLIELGEKYNIFKRVGNRISIGGSNVYPKSILSDPEKYFTDEVMAKLEEAARTEYIYGN